MGLTLERNGANKWSSRDNVLSPTSDQGLMDRWVINSHFELMDHLKNTMLIKKRVDSGLPWMRFSFALRTPTIVYNGVHLGKFDKYLYTRDSKYDEIFAEALRDSIAVAVTHAYELVKQR